MPSILNSDWAVSKLCPIRSYEKYIHYLNEQYKYLWQTPKYVAYEKGETIWYKKKRIGENTFGQFMTELST